MAQVVDAPHPPIREEWLALRREEILLPELPIVDPHHHLWDRAGSRYLLPELLADVQSGHNVQATVYVQARSMYRAWGPAELRPLGEVEFANGVAAQSASGIYGPVHACAGIVGFADLTLGERVTPVLEALQRAGGDRLRGIRNSTAWHESAAVRSSPVVPPPGLLMHAAFREGVRSLEPFGLSLDICAYHTQLHEVLALARAVPDTTIVLDHVGGPIGVGPYAGKREQVFRAWREVMAALAACENVFVKLGGLTMKVGGFAFHEREMPPSSEELAEAFRPYIETCIELFGCSRCMFESNFPVDKSMVSYAVLWNAFKRLAGAYSESEQTALFSRTAAGIYRLTRDRE
jgi:predicted TIM-barrel fold metal-dependent hydrolase